MPKRKIILARALFLVFFISPLQMILGNEINWHKKVWLENAFKVLESGKYPRIKAISYWHEKWTNADGMISNLRIDSSESSLKAYRESISKNLYGGEPVFHPVSGAIKLLPSKNMLFLSAFPDFGPTEDMVTSDKISEFERLSGRPIVWAYFSNNWYDGIVFPKESVEVIQKTRKIPFIRLMMRSREGGLPDPKYNLQDLIDGKYDKELNKWADQAKNVKGPLIVEFGPEMNGDWFPWSGKWNGADKKDGFGDPKLADGPERFRQAYRHLVDLFKKSGLSHLTWFFHVDANSSPDVGWNHYDAYYPGGAYVDWIGVSAYGPSRPQGGNYEEFVSIMDRAYPKLTSLSPDKPLAVLEWGIAEDSQKKH